MLFDKLRFDLGDVDVDMAAGAAAAFASYERTGRVNKLVDQCINLAQFRTSPTVHQLNRSGNRILLLQQLFGDARHEEVSLLYRLSERMLCVSRTCTTSLMHG
ncbi:hypothetical protein BCR16_01755 [Ralstonia solanacearum FJAT-1458]|nr:hypothetical protein BCR16_01755 [Ralstonia solanacearum FJAT-1458]